VSYVSDGRSLKPVLKGNATSWRSAILLEAHHTSGGGATPAYRGIRTNGGTKYVEYAGGKKYLFYCGRDHQELDNSILLPHPPRGWSRACER